MDITKVPLPLVLDYSYNTRELGGYQTKSGKTLRKNRLLRSDSIHKLSEKDKNFLYDYGLRCVIDFRSKMEVEDSPSGLIGFKDIELVDIPLIDHINSDGFKGTLPKSMGEMYIEILESSSELIAKAMKTINRFPTECVLYNCTEGKDRTGVVSMLILLLCGVDEETVLADYSTSRKNLSTVIEEQKAMLLVKNIKVPDYVFDSNPKEMKKAIDFLTEKYENVINYLKIAGMSDDEIDNLKNRMF